MNIGRRVPSFAFLLLTSFIPFGEAQCPGNVVPVRYHSLGHAYMSIPISVDGAGPFEFMVDTGSEITTIEPSIASELGLQPRSRGGLTSVVGRAVVEIVIPDLIEVGGHLVRQPMVAVQSLRQLQTVDRNLRGILGEDVLARFDLLIDRKKQILCFDETGQMHSGMRGEHIPLLALPGRNSGSSSPDRLLITAKLAGGSSREAIFCLDSGTNMPLLRAESARMHRLWIMWDRALRGGVVDQRASFIPLWPRQDVRIGTHVLRDVAFVTAATTGSTVALEGEDGQLPTSLFNRIFISYANRFVVLEPQ